jgi:hypothetical protein
VLIYKETKYAMPTSETISIIQNLADVIGLPPLAIETGFLLLFMILILLIVLFVRAILRIKEENDQIQCRSWLYSEFA